jgi:hypothetical protein
MEKRNSSHVPQSYNEIPRIETFPYFYTHNKSDEETFLFLDRIYIPPEGNNGTAYRLLAFMSQRSATEVANASKVLIDGTFKVAANPFAQLFTISSFKGGIPIKFKWFLAAGHCFRLRVSTCILTFSRSFSTSSVLALVDH